VQPSHSDNIEVGDLVVVKNLLGNGYLNKSVLNKFVGEIRKVVHANEYDHYYVLEGIVGSGHFFFAEELDKIDVNSLSDLEKLLYDVE